QIGKLSPLQSGGTPPPAGRSADASPPAGRNVSPDRSLVESPAKPFRTKVQAPAIESPTANAPEASTSDREESASDKPEVAIVTDFDAWEVKVDPPDEPFEIDAKKRIVATFPRNASDDVV